MTTVIAPVTRTATRTLKMPCQDCAQPITAGQQYTDYRHPPGGEMGYCGWVRAVYHAPTRYLPDPADVTGCDLVAAYAEKEARESVRA